MQVTSEIYKDLFYRLQNNDPFVFYETRIAIGESGRLITRSGDGITFGGIHVLVGSSGPDNGFGEESIIEAKTLCRVFSENMPSVGACVSSEITVRIIKPLGDIPRQARVMPYVRLSDGASHSEWIQKGVYFIDTRTDSPASNFTAMTITGYDAMLKAEADYPSSKMSWPAKDIDVVKEIAQKMDVPVDARTLAAMNKGYKINYPSGYSQREVLGYLASMYAGCFVMSDLGELLLVQLGKFPAETSYLSDKQNAITFGGVRIRV